jgi:hypothetical protein
MNDSNSEAWSYAALALPPERRGWRQENEAPCLFISPGFLAINYVDRFCRHESKELADETKNEEGQGYPGKNEKET